MHSDFFSGLLKILFFMRHECNLSRRRDRRFFVTQNTALSYSYSRHMTDISDVLCRQGSS